MFCVFVVQGAVVEVSHGTDEYAFVEDRFREGFVSTLGTPPPREFLKQIVKIERVQNIKLWTKYSCCKVALVKTNGGDPNEQLRLHLSSQSVVKFHVNCVLKSSC